MTAVSKFVSYTSEQCFHCQQLQSWTNVIIPLVFDDFLLFPQGPELPSDKGIIVWVHVGGDEGSPPVHAASHCSQVTLSKGREEFEPVVRRSTQRRWNSLIEHVSCGC